MRKKSHISLARYLVRNLDDGDLRKHKLSFYIGSILPDCKPSFLYKKHEITGTFPQVKREIERLSSDYQKKYKRQTSKYYRNLGQVTHYLADYFTFPHNKIYPGNLKDHCMYEKELKLYLREYLNSEEAMEKQSSLRDFCSVESLIDFIRQEHREYLRTFHSVAEDCRYIIQLCRNVVRGIVQLLQVKRAPQAIVAVAV